MLSVWIVGCYTHVPRYFRGFVGLAAVLVQYTSLRVPLIGYLVYPAP
jgi:hypothetical protein